MFTGLIEETGRVAWLRRSSERGIQLQVNAPLIGKSIHTGDSIAVNGCCLTVTSHRNEAVTFDLLQETLDRTNLRFLRPEMLVNLERALPADGRVGGHFVQGHIDCAVRVISFEERGDDYRLELETPAHYSHYLPFKGSIAINGISLTLAEVLDRSFAVWIIPHTRKVTNLRATQAGEVVNLEFDIIAKYVERMMLARRA